MTEKQDDFKNEKYWLYVEEFVTELKTAKYWFKNDGSPLPDWKLFEDWDAAWDAARDAARDAAWDAARGAGWNAGWNAERDAAMNAAWNAAWDAARDAAWNAGWNAERDAAWNAGWNAAWDAARDAARDAGLFARLLVCIGLEVDVKHLAHVNARMQVWRKGYGLVCDVNGVLYVYKKP